MAHIFYNENGKYAIFSTVSDTFMFWDYEDLEQLKTAYVETMLKSQEESIKMQFDQCIKRMERRAVEKTPAWVEWKFAVKDHNKRVSKEERIKL